MYGIPEGVGDFTFHSFFPLLPTSKKLHVTLYPLLFSSFTPLSPPPPPSTLHPFIPYSSFTPPPPPLSPTTLLPLHPHSPPTFLPSPSYLNGIPECWSQKHTHISDVHGDVQCVKNIVNESRCHHQTWIYLQREGGRGLLIEGGQGLLMEGGRGLLMEGGRSLMVSMTGVTHTVRLLIGADYWLKTCSTKL